MRTNAIVPINRGYDFVLQMAGSNIHCQYRPNVKINSSVQLILIECFEEYASECLTVQEREKRNVIHRQLEIGIRKERFSREYQLIN